jgi:hypothetical protein
MNVKDLVVGKIYKDEENTKLKYLGVIPKYKFYESQHDFDSIEIEESGCICTDAEVEEFISELDEPTSQSE